MKFTSTFALVLTGASFTQALHKGFNIGANRPNGQCKSQADWETNFRAVRALPGGFKDVRLYASSDCNTLQNAVPAALNTGIKLLVGVWAEDATHYNNEKIALQNAMTAHGHSWISAVSVGSEDLYRGDTNAQTLAQQIYDVRGMISQPQFGGAGIKVGHVDTWNAWVDPNNAAVIQAAAFIGVDAYPYFQGSSIGSSKQTFYNALNAVNSAVAQYHPGTPVWVTETSWPVSGPSDGAAVPSVANAQTYWQQTMCSLFGTYNTFVYTLRDYTSSPSFGVVDVNFKPIYNLNC